MSWMGTYSERTTPARFVPAVEPARLVTPALAFQPDSSGGSGVPSVTGDRHDQVAKKAPAWFRASIDALAGQKAGVSVLARKVGSAGKYRFWSTPLGVTTLAQWEAATGAMVAERDGARADALAARIAVATARAEARHNAEAAKLGGLVIEFDAGEYVSGGWGDVCLAKSVALTDGGDTVVIETVLSGYSMFSCPVFTTVGRVVAC